MNLSLERLLAEAEATAFRPEILEKVAILLALLEGVSRHPYLKTRVALKGGTALNLFLFDIPRLSVDIDLNYVGAADRDTMLAERPEVERALEAVCEREGVSIARAPGDFAGGKWRMRYQSVLGGNGNIEVDLNFMFRIPLWPISMHDAHPLGPIKAERIPILDIHEIAAGKLAALFSRRAGRDLFDAHALLTRVPLDDQKLHTAFVAIGAMNRKDWRTISIDDVDFETGELHDQLLPVLRTASRMKGNELTDWATNLVAECRTALDRLLPFTKSELDFLNRILDYGEIEPLLLTDDPDLADRIARHPLLAWKARNVRKYRKKQR